MPILDEFSISVRGDIIPAVEGTYHPTAYDNSHPIWANPVTEYFIWHHPEIEDLWYLGTPTPLESPEGPHWTHNKPNANGHYTPADGAQGKAYVNFIKTKQPKPVPWEFWGMQLEHLVRHGDEKLLHGQAFWARTNWPPGFTTSDFSEWPKPWLTLAVPDWTHCCWEPNFNRATFHEHWESLPLDNPLTQVSIFQIRPDKAELPYERKFTRFCGYANPWPTLTYDNILPFTPQWTPPAGVQVRYFARIWHHMQFRHVGPAWTTPCVPPDACPCSEEDWQDLVDSGITCHGLHQIYRLKEYYDGMVKACTQCDASGDPVWDGTLHALDGSPCNWKQTLGAKRIDGKTLYYCGVYLHANEWYLNLNCRKGGTPVSMWYGKKLIGQTPAGRYRLEGSDCSANQPTVLTVEEPWI